MMICSWSWRSLTHGCVVGIGEALVHPLPHEHPAVIGEGAFDDLVVVLLQLSRRLCRQYGERTQMVLYNSNAQIMAPKPFYFPLLSSRFVKMTNPWMYLDTFIVCSATVLLFSLMDSHHYKRAQRRAAAFMNNNASHWLACVAAMLFFKHVRNMLLNTVTAAFPT